MRIEDEGDAETDKRCIESERVKFAPVHGLGPAVGAPGPKDAATVAPKMLNSSSEEGGSGSGLPELTGSLATLKTIEPAGINAVAEDEWVEIEIAVDSGATETVMSEEALNGIIDITESAACKRGIVYEVADGAQTPNLGELNYLGITCEGCQQDREQWQQSGL